MICVKKHRHARLPLELALTDEPAKSDYFRKIFVVFEAADSFFVPGFRLLPGERGLEFREFFFDAFQSCFELSCGLCHVAIVRQPALGSKTNKGTNKGDTSNYQPAFRASDKSGHYQPAKRRH